MVFSAGTWTRGLGALLAAAILAAPAPAPAAGSAPAEAANQALWLPGGVALDAAGDLFIADTGNHQVLMVSPAGIITPVAGTGAPGSGGDGGPATASQLDSPTGVAVDAAGNLYIADSRNHRIREVSGGIIATIAGTGVAGFAGDGGPATAARLDLPTAVAVDDLSNVYLADTRNHRIRKIQGGTIATVAGNGCQGYGGDGGPAVAACLDSPRSVAVDGGYNLYIADTGNHRVRKVTYGTGNCSTWAGTGTMGFNGDGPAGSAALAGPRGIAVDGSGTVYVADSDNHRIRAISGGQLATIAGNGRQGHSGDGGAATGGALDTPCAVAVLGQALVFADRHNHAIRQVSGSGLDTVAGSPPPEVEGLTLSGAVTSALGTGTLTATFVNGTRVATGTVSLRDGLGPSPVQVSSATLAGNQATLATGQLPVGLHRLLASYPGDADNAPVASGIFVVVVTPAATATVLTCSPSSPVSGNAATFTAVVSSPAFTPAPTGSVTFLDGATSMGTGALDASGTAILATSALSAGNHVISAAYGGDSNHQPSSAAATLVVGQAPASIALTASSGGSHLGEAVTFTATVATPGSTPTGQVDFLDGATRLGSSALQGGTAACTTSGLATGSHTITACYLGCADVAGGSSSALTFMVAQPALVLSATPSALTLHRGGSGSAAIRLEALGNPVGPVSLSASGLPPGLTVEFSSATLDAASLPATVQVQVRSTGLQISRRDPVGFWTGGGGAFLACGVLALPFAGRRRLRWAGLAALLALAGLAGLPGCGGWTLGHDNASAPTTYAVTITAQTAGAAAGTATLNVTLD